MIFVTHACRISAADVAQSISDDATRDKHTNKHSGRSVYTCTTVSRAVVESDAAGHTEGDRADSQPFTELLISARMSSVGLKLYSKDHTLVRDVCSNHHCLFLSDL